jgi:hypothetical protein
VFAVSETVTVPADRKVAGKDPGIPAEGLDLSHELRELLPGFRGLAGRQQIFDDRPSRLR